MGLEGVWGSLQEGTSNFKDAAAGFCQGEKPNKCMVSHRVHVWTIYLHLGILGSFHVGKYISHMDPMGSKESYMNATRVCPYKLEIGGMGPL